MRFISKRILEKFISVSNKDTWACDIIIFSFQGRGVAICYIAQYLTALNIV